MVLACYIISEMISNGEHLRMLLNKPLTLLLCIKGLMFLIGYSVIFVTLSFYWSFVVSIIGEKYENLAGIIINVLNMAVAVLIMQLSYL